jgi:hypothetical protein
MLHEAAEELFVGKSHHAALAVMGVVFPSEADAAVVHRQEAMIGDGHTMGVASQVLQDVIWAAERFFGVDHPILPKESAHERGEGFLLRERLALSIEAKLMLAESAAQAGNELTAKDAAEHSHRQEEARG